MSESDFCDNIPSEMGIDEDVQHWLRFPESAMVSAETAEVLRVSPGTVKRDWKLARVWLLEEITGERGDGRWTVAEARVAQTPLLGLRLVGWKRWRERKAMEAERWRKIEQLYHAALEREPSGRVFSPTGLHRPWGSAGSGTANLAEPLS